MAPLQIVFSNYTIVGLTLLILAGSLAIYLLLLQDKSRATRSLIAFFVMVALSGVAIILTNSIQYWQDLFRPWQDFWILASGVALALFAYSVPGYERTRESLLALAVTGGVALVALAYSLLYSYRFLFAWSPQLEVSDTYYLLLPFGILIVVVIFLRRSVWLSARTETAGGRSRIPHLGSRLVQPQDEEAVVLRNLALALSLAFLPGLQTFLQLPHPYGFLLSNIGSALAIVAIALVYFNYAPEVNSFMAKLVGITLATVLLLFAVFGAVDVYATGAERSAERWRPVAAVQYDLLDADIIRSDGATLAYVAAWNAADPTESDSYQLLYESEELVAFNLNTLIDDNRTGALDARSWEVGGALPERTDRNWRSIWRSLHSPAGVPEQYLGHIFIEGSTAYEIGISMRAEREHLSGVVSKWLMLILTSSAVILLGFPWFFKRTLVRPIDNLLDGIGKVDEGDLDTVVPIQFHDEIGSLTESFNRLTRSLDSSRRQQDQLVQQLEASREELEERVTDRTRELSAFADLTMLPGSYEDLAEILQPALGRIMEIGLCQVLCVHLLSSDQGTLELLAHRNLPGGLTMKLGSVPVSPAFLACMSKTDDPVLVSRHSNHGELPSELRAPPHVSYLGSPLAAGSHLHGWLSCYRQNDDGFTMSEISLLVALARQMGVIVENHRLRQRIQDVATYEERSRLARDLHDAVTQLVYSMTLFSRSAQEALDDNDLPRLQTNLEHISDTALETLREMRFMLFELQPPNLDEKGLAGALNTRFDMVERRVGIRVESNLGESAIDSKATERELYYVAIEALNNTLKHAGADQVQVTVERDNGCVRLCIADNGCGFDADQVKSGYGIENMRQRIEGLGGDLKINTAIDQGTRVIASIPRTHGREGA